MMTWMPNISSTMNRNRRSIFNGLIPCTITNIMWYFVLQEQVLVWQCSTWACYCVEKDQWWCFYPLKLSKKHIHSCILEFKIIFFWMLLMMLQFFLNSLKFVLLLQSIGLNTTFMVLLVVFLTHPLVLEFIEI